MPQLQNPPPFNVGDIVRLKNGTAPQVVRALLPHASYPCHWLIKATYQNDPDGDLYGSSWRAARDYVKLDPDTHEDLVFDENEPKRKNDMPKLYQVNAETDTFGTFLAHNSEGQIVLEMKGDGGKVRAFNKSDLTEVKPYTVALTNSMSGQRHVQYRVVKGSLAVGDLVAVKGQILTVAAVNTGASGAPALRGARKLFSTAVEEAVDDAKTDTPADDE